MKFMQIAIFFFKFIEINNNFVWVLWKIITLKWKSVTIFYVCKCVIIK